VCATKAGSIKETKARYSIKKNILTRTSIDLEIDILYIYCPDIKKVSTI